MMGGENYKTEKWEFFFLNEIHFLDKANILEVLYAMGMYQTLVHHCWGPSAENMYVSIRLSRIFPFLLFCIH